MLNKQVSSTSLPYAHNRQYALNNHVHLITGVYDRPVVACIAYRPVVVVALRSMTCLSTMVRVLLTQAGSCSNEQALSVVWSLVSTNRMKVSTNRMNNTISTRVLSNHSLISPFGTEWLSQCVQRNKPLSNSPSIK